MIFPRFCLYGTLFFQLMFLYYILRARARAQATHFCYFIMS